MQDDEQSLNAGETPDGAADDEWRVEPIDNAVAPAAARLATLTQRLWWAWRRPHGGGWMPRGLVWTLGSLLALVLVLLASDAQPVFGTQMVEGGAPVAVQPGEAMPSITIDGQPPTQVGVGSWKQIALPALPGARVVGFAPSPVDPATAYACTDGPDSGELRLWRTRDTGAHWSSLALPPLVGVWCQISVTPDAPSRVALFSGTATDYPACDSNPLYLSDDGGDRWLHIAAPGFGPADALASGCVFWPTAHHLYFLYSYERGSRDEPIGRGPQLSILTRSDDDGRTWVRADRGLGDDALFLAFQVGDDNTLAAGVLREGAHPEDRGVWMTRDAGTTWSKLTAASPPWTTNLVTLPLPGVGLHSPMYAMIEEQLPAMLFRLKVSERVDDTRSWVILPPLPVPGTSPTRAGLLQIVGEAGDGRLLALGVDPQAGVPSESAMSGPGGWAGTSAQWLWVWDQRVGRWLVWPTPLPLPYTWGCGVCLEHQTTWAPGLAPSGGTDSGTYLWLRPWLGQGLGAGAVAYRIFVPDAPPGQLSA